MTTSDQTIPLRRRGRPPKARTAPEISVSERQSEPQEALYQGDLDEAEKLIAKRLERGVFDYASAGVEFHNDNLVGRWFNQGVSDQQIYRARQRGWIPVRPEMVKNLEALGVYDVAGGSIVRGQRGEEHLMCMTKTNYERVMRAKTDANRAKMGSTKKVKSEMAEAAARDLGPEAAEWVQSQTFGEITDSVERVERMNPDE